MGNSRSKLMWTREEDMLLIKHTSRYLREGKGQVDSAILASEFVPGRTADACKSRWSTSLREKYEIAIMLAKDIDEPKPITFDDVINFIGFQKVQIVKLEEAIEELQAKIDSMNPPVDYKEKYERLKTEHDMIMSILAQAKIANETDNEFV